MGLFSKLKEGLTKTRHGFTEKVEDLFRRNKKIDDETLEELEEILISADVGVKTTMKLIGRLNEKVMQSGIDDSTEVYSLLKAEVLNILGDEDKTELNINHPLTVIMVVGVNGVGKTTTIGKLAYKLKQRGSKVLLVAGDTFRAAAIDQLLVWGQRVGVEVIHQREGSDPAAVVFDGLQAAKARKNDVVIIDTAGRLHTKVNLMEELKKVFRVIQREVPGAPHEVLIVLDATTGQNALSQAKLFGEAVQVTGIVLTKLDGTAKGGIVIAIKDEQGIPIKFVGIGEKLEDLQEFSPREFAEAIFE